MVTPNWVRRPNASPSMVHVSASAATGGVAELLHGLVHAQVRTGVSAGWAVIAGDDEFHDFTRYLDRLLHGRADTLTTDRLNTSAGHYRTTLAAQADWLIERLAPGDVVVLHDPATLGMARPLADAGLRVGWHCHLGTTEEEASGPAAVWHHFAAELSSVDAVVTTLPEYAPQRVPLARRHVLAPAIDPLSAKNRPLSTREVDALLAGIGLTEPGTTPGVEQDQPLPPEARTVVQVSRWAPFKDMPGVLRCVPNLPADVHLVLAGPEPDNAESRAVLDEVRALRAQLAADDRDRVHLVLTSTTDAERTALVVNALQRRADVVLHKSVAEGFGLPVAEAMIKGKAVVAGDVGGLRQQISPGHNGVLVDPRRTADVVGALDMLLGDPILRRRLGNNAAESTARRYLMTRLVADYQIFAVPGQLAVAA
ncbi:glycosyltransferase [Actinophytocola sediminis]